MHDNLESPCCSSELLAQISNLPISTILHDCVVCVDVWSFNGNDNRSNVFENILIKMGATIVKKWTKEENVTHLVFKDGHKSLLNKAKKQKVSVVGYDWVEQCRTTQSHAQEKDYLYNENMYKPPKRFREMQPLDEETRLQRSNERIRRIKIKANKKNTRIFFQSPVANISPLSLQMNYIHQIGNESTILAPNTPFPSQATKQRFFSPIVIPESPCDDETSDASSLNIFTQGMVRQDNASIVAPNTPYLTQQMNCGKPNKYFSPIMVPETPCETLRSKLLRGNNSALTPPVFTSFDTPENSKPSLKPQLIQNESSTEPQTILSPDPNVESPMNLHVSDTSTETSITFSDRISPCNQSTPSIKSSSNKSYVTDSQNQIEILENLSISKEPVEPATQTSSQTTQQPRVIRRLLNVSDDTRPLSFLGSPCCLKDSFTNPVTIHKKLTTAPKVLQKKIRKDKQKSNSQKSMSKKRKRTALGNVTDEYKNTKNILSQKKNENINSNFNKDICLSLNNRRSSCEFQSSKSLLRKNGKSKKCKLVIVLTNYHTEERQRILSTLNSYIGKWFKIKTSVTKDTTHVISGANRRTLSIVYAMTYGNWILSEKWLIDSIAAGKLLDECNYEQSVHFPIARCNRALRQINLRWKNNVFEKFKGVCYVAENTNPPSKDLTELIKLCKGSTTKSCLRATICIGKCEKSFWHNSQVPRIQETWLLDCITQNKLLDYSLYLL